MMMMNGTSPIPYNQPSGSKKISCCHSWHCTMNTINTAMCLCYQARRKCSGRIAHHLLQLPSHSCFIHLFNSGQNDALNTATGVSFATYQNLLKLFTPVYFPCTSHVLSESNIIQLPFHIIEVEHDY